jgi:formyltetrahydrofolate synthetase
MLLENLLDFISIEPMRENLTCLIENVRRFKLKNVVVIDKALSDRDGSSAS